MTWGEKIDGPAMREHLRSLDKARRCLCGVLSFEFVRVIDDTPRRELQS
jgi:hypothetical protein